jgi:hypothetical protein
VSSADLTLHPSLLAGCLFTSFFMGLPNHTFDPSSSDVFFVFCSVLRNDSYRDNRRRCIISFAASDNALGDQNKFLFENSRKTGYCGRYGIHAGVSDELWQITHDDQYSEIIKPALETCHEVTCVGFSLGGSLCNLFTMCANQGAYSLDQADGEGEDLNGKSSYCYYLFQ